MYAQEIATALREIESKLTILKGFTSKLADSTDDGTITAAQQVEILFQMEEVSSKLGKAYNTLAIMATRDL